MHSTVRLTTHQRQVSPAVLCIADALSATKASTGAISETPLDIRVEKLRGSPLFVQYNERLRSLHSWEE